MALASPSGDRKAEASASASASTSGEASGTSDASARGPKSDRWIYRHAPERHTIELGVWGGVLFSSRRHELYDPNVATQLRFRTAALDLGARFGYYPLSWLGGELEGGLMPTRTAADSRALLYTVRGHVIGQLPMWSIAPFLVIGGGGMGIAKNGTLGRDIDASFHWGPGVKFFLNRWVALRLDLRHLVGARVGYKDGAASHFEILLGVSFTLRTQSNKDQDGDKVRDDEDRCPTTPGVKPHGCPADDRDGDGFLDGDDQCPDDPGIAPDGCPGDTDSDGLRDHEDRCPTVAGPKPDGCPPDEDKDGIFDEKDDCRREPETRNGYEDDDGCPDEVPKRLRGASGAMAGITFEVNSARVTGSSRKSLDEAAARLKANPDYEVEIVGHTDSTGSREHNIELSQKRADAVREYLVAKGIEKDRINTRGAGPDDPIAKNNTPEGRAENRRIEFKVRKIRGTRRDKEQS